MSWTSKLRGEVEQEFRDAHRRKGAHEFAPDEVDIGPRPEPPDPVITARRRIVVRPTTTSPSAE